MSAMYDITIFVYIGNGKSFGKFNLKNPLNFCPKI